MFIFPLIFLPCFQGSASTFLTPFPHTRTTVFTGNKVIANVALEVVENKAPLPVYLGWRPTLEKKELGICLRLIFSALENKRWFVAQTQPCVIYNEGSKLTLRGGLVLSLQVFLLSTAYLFFDTRFQAHLSEALQRDMSTFVAPSVPWPCGFGSFGVARWAPAGLVKWRCPHFLVFDSLGESEPQLATKVSETGCYGSEMVPQK